MAEEANGMVAGRLGATVRQRDKSPGAVEDVGLVGSRRQGARSPGGKKPAGPKLEKRCFYLEPKVIDALLLVCRRMNPRRDPSKHVNELIRANLIRYDIGRMLLEDSIPGASVVDETPAA
jgi:hypothetical protein